jgi:hypothetical protein
VYSTGRTIGQTAIFDLNTHISRLAMIDKAVPLKEAPTPLQIRERLLYGLKVAISTFLTLNSHIKAHSYEVKLTMLLTCPNNPSDVAERELTFDELDLYVIAEELKPPPSPPIKIELRLFGRPNPHVKDAHWVTERKALEDQMSTDVNEVVMYRRHIDNNNERFEITEGLSSNFFVLQHDVLLTAPDTAVAPFHSNIFR